jgi:transketolase
MNTLKTDSKLLKKLSDCIRILSVDAIEKAKSGHPGLPLGMADVMTLLVFEFLRFDPQNPKWPDRDRLVLSAGHGSMLLYAFYYLAGYKDFTLDDLKRFRQLGSKTPGHPEYGVYPAIETTTGPLGQGLANAVGMAISAKKQGKKHKIYAIVGDGCLMEGISYEAISLAAHLKLDNLIIIFDDNSITIDGDTSLAVSENHIEKFHALGWNSFAANGHDFYDIHKALNVAYFSSKPSFISVQTIIGYGAPTKAGSEAAHGSPLGSDEVVGLRHKLGWYALDQFAIPEELMAHWRDAWKHNYQISRTELETHKDYYYDFECKSIYDMHASNDPEPTRVSSGRVVSYLMNISNKIIVGSADLAISNNLLSPTARVITGQDYSGNFIHYGVREHAMAAVMNGLALEGYKAVGGTFLTFSDYMRPAIRLAAMMKLPVVYVFTHDSIGLGEDGPTHQPIEHLASLRAIPNLYVFRPADFVETVESWQIAWARSSGPCILALSRQNVPQIRDREGENLSFYGAYIIHDMIEPQITIFATGSEVQIAMELRTCLASSGVRARVVSVTCVELFKKQEREYYDNIMYASQLNVVIEAGVRLGWEKFLGPNGLFFGVEDFGHSAPSVDLYKHFGLVASVMATQVIDQLELVSYAAK